MKRYYLIGAAALTLSLSACAGTPTQSTAETSTAAMETEAIAETEHAYAETHAAEAAGPEETTSAGTRAYSGYSSSGSTYSSDEDSDFEKYLKENDPDSYDNYQELEENWNEGDWDPENGFFDDDSADSNDSDTGFESYLKENDPASYDTYQRLEENWNEGDWDPENGFLGD